MKLGVIFLLEVWMLLPHRLSGSQLLWPLMGMAGGGFLRIGSWKATLPRMRPVIRVAAWFVVVSLGLSIVAWSFMAINIIVYPSALREHQPESNILLWPGMIIGWLWIQLSLARRRKSP